MILAIDPGNVESAYVILDERIIESGKINNDLMLSNVYEWGRHKQKPMLYIEMIASYGMPVGKDVFDTCVFIGRLIEAYGSDCVELVYRKTVKMHHCGSMKAKDGNIIQALKDKYGQKGTKKEPGFFYDTKADVWQAFAVAAYIKEREEALVW